MEQVRDNNLNNTAFCPTEFMVFFEKHLLLLLWELIHELITKRPANVGKYVALNIRRMHEKLLSTNTFLLLPPNFDTKKFVTKLRNMYNIPTIVYTKPRREGDTEEILEEFERFASKLGLKYKHKIYINFPSNCKEALAFKRKTIQPSSVVRVKPGFQPPFKTEKMIEDQEETTYVNGFKEIEKFYEKVFHVIHYTSNNYCEDHSRGNVRETINQVVHGLLRIIRNVEIPETSINGSRLVPRIVIYGRRGAGKKTQAIALAREFNLIYLDMDSLIYKYLQSNCALGDALRRNIDEDKEFSDLICAEIVHKAVLQRSCIDNGWVIVGYPSDRKGFENMEKFKVPPNKLIFLHCRERVATRRTIKRFEQKYSNKTGLEYKNVKPKYTFEYIQKENEYFNILKPEILNYLHTKKEAIHIDGNHSFHTVKSNIWARVYQQQQNIGLSFPAPK